jgi:hypothetical protein
VYDRHTYDIDKADALNRVAQLVDTIINPAQRNVANLENGR